MEPKAENALTVEQLKARVYDLSRQAMMLQREIGKLDQMIAQMETPQK